MDFANAYDTAPQGKLQTNSTSTNAHDAGGGSQLDGSSTNTSAPTELKFLCFNFELIKSYFDVSTLDVAHRLLEATFPFKSLKLPDNDKSLDFRNFPDWYGPIWIATTLFLTVFAMSNYSCWLYNRTWRTDFAFLGVAAALTFGSLVVIPLIASVLVRLVIRTTTETGMHATTASPSTGQSIPSSLGFAPLICVLGYSFLMYIPMSLVCIIPYSVAKWIACTIAFFTGTFFTAKSLMQDLVNNSPFLRYAVLGYIGLCQVGLFVAFRMYFFAVPSPLIFGGV